MVKKIKLNLVKINNMEHSPEQSPRKDTASVKHKSLILLNDNFNDFDHIIDCLVLVCNHTLLQAEQCALIAHHKGSCVIKKGSFLELVNYKKDLTL